MNQLNSNVKIGHSTSHPRVENGGTETARIVWPDTQPSFRSEALDQLLLLMGRKKWWASAAAVQQRARRLALRPASHRPVRLGCNVKFDLRFVEGWPVYELHTAQKIGARHHVVFLHGGAYVHEIVGSHWSFVGHLAQETGSDCVVPIYPLAPRGTAKEVVPTTGRILSELIQAFGAQNVTVIGNSAGGGLAVAAAQWLRGAGFSQPNRLILICPGVNGALDRCEPIDAARDVMQDVPGMIEAFRMYAGGLDIRHPFVSPLNGTFDGLAPMLIFNGTHDLYRPDIMVLADKAAHAGVPVEMHVRNGLQHNYPLLPTPEGREARQLIARVIADAAVQADHEAVVAFFDEMGSSGTKPLGSEMDKLPPKWSR
jgi:epsilon-lactone hydrolase